MKKRIASLMMVAALAAGTLTGCGGLKENETVATVGNAKITGDIANFYARYQQAQVESTYGTLLGENMWEQTMGGEKTFEETTKEGIIDGLEKLYILEQHMSDYDVTLSDEEKEEIKKAAVKFDEDNGLNEKAVVSGDAGTVERMLTLFTIENKMRKAMTADVSTEVTDEEAAQKSMQYVEFSFNTTDKSGSSTELSDDEKKELKKEAAAFAEKVAAGEDFNAASEAAGYTVKTATFDKESTIPNTDLIAVADKLEEGACSAVVESSTAYYVAKVTSLLDRTATDNKKTTIVGKRRTDKFNEIYEGWNKDTKIEVNEKAWKKISFKKQGVSMFKDETEPYEE